MWGLLTVLAGNMLIDALEVSALMVATPAISAELGLSPAAGQWTLTAFALGFGGLMLFGGRLVALLGRRRCYLIALLVFAAASMIAGTSDSVEPLIATRLVKGFCAALTAPTGLAIITTRFAEGTDRARAISVYTLFGTSGFTAGLLASGLLTEVDWRWTLAFPAPVVLVLFAAGLVLIPRDPPAPGPAPLDLAGAWTFVGALFALVYTVSAVPSTGWTSARVLVGLVTAVVLAVACWLIERGARAPLLDAGVLRHRPLLLAALGAASLNGSYLGLLFILSNELQAQEKWTPTRTALAFLPACLPPAVTALRSGRLVARWGAPRLIPLGALAAFLGYLWFLRASAPLSYAVDLLPTLVLVGFAFVVSFAALNAQATGTVPAESRTVASATYQTAVQVGAALVLVLVAALLTVYRPAVRPAAIVVACAGLAGVLVGSAGRKPRP